jgi:2-polyprenyl-6-methoxyphenol hydroxylase-like FAD-dependent oxidoreductase
MAERVPVLIVGAGPVGLALAGDLGWRGVPCLLIEKTDGAIEQPKMDIVGPRTMEFCRRWGIADWVRDAPYPGDYPQDCIYVTGLNGYELGREPFPGRAHEKCPPQSPQKRERAPQDMFDPILQRFVRTFPHVTLAYHSELMTFEESANEVVATVRDVRTSATRKISADYLVGTDGGASTVRERAGITMSGNPALTYTTNVMFRCPDFSTLHDKRKGYRFIFIGPEGTWLTIVAINGGDRFRMSIVGSADKVMHTEADIRAALRRAMGRDFDYQILSVMRWVRRELVADRYGTERVFIAGDAAHLMSPTGGFGMNTGIQDSVDLSWKLDARLRGWGGEELLRSYETERRPVAIRNVTEASGNLGRMLSTRQRRPPPEIFVPGAAGDAARRLADRLAGRHAGAALGDLDLYPDRAAGGAGAARLAAGRALDPRPLRPRLHLAAVGCRCTESRAPARRRGGRRRAARRRRSRCARRRRALSAPARAGSPRRASGVARRCGTRRRARGN